MKILTFTTVYPNPLETALGVFIRSRALAMAKLAEVKVIAPTPIFNYRRRSFSLQRGFPRRRVDAGMDVLSPRWFYPPGLNALNPLFLFLSVVWPVSRFHDEYRYDIIDAHFAHPDGIAAALLAAALRRPFTITLRGNEQEHRQHWLRRRSMSWAVKRAQRVIAVAGVLQDLALELGADPRRVVTIPNGIDTTLFHLRDREAMRRKFDVPATARLIVSAGNLIELKGHHHTIRAVRGLVDAGADVSLLIAGGAGSGASREAALRHEVSQLQLDERVKFLGVVPPETLAELLCAADVFCLASSREGWPNVVHEALACGTPVVSTRVGGVPEMIPSDTFGILAPPNDPLALKEALSRALSTNWDRTQIAGWGKVRSWDQVAAEVVREMGAAVREYGSKG